MLSLEQAGSSEKTAFTAKGGGREEAGERVGSLA